jgi:hypothetical protein
MWIRGPEEAIPQRNNNEQGNNEIGALRGTDMSNTEIL